MFVENKVTEDFNNLSYCQKRKIKHEKIEAVKHAISSNSAKLVKRFYLTIPTNEAHQNHDPNHKGKVLVQPLHKDIIEKIYELVGEGIINPRIIKLQLRDFVKNVLLCDSFKNVDPLNSTYFPDLPTISDHVRLALRAYRYNKLDQVSLQAKIIVAERRMLKQINIFSSSINNR